MSYRHCLLKTKNCPYFVAEKYGHLTDGLTTVEQSKRISARYFFKFLNEIVQMMSLRLNVNAGNI